MFPRSTAEACTRAKLTRELATRARDARGLGAAALKPTRLAKEALLLAGHVGKLPRIAVCAHALAKSIGKLAARAGRAQRRAHAGLRLALGATHAHCLARHIDVSTRRAEITRAEPKLIGKRASQAQGARGLPNAALVCAWLAPKARGLSSRVCELANLAVKARALAKSLTGFARHTGVTQSRTQAASKVSLLAIHAGRLPSEIHMCARSTAEACTRAKLTRELATRARDARGLGAAALKPARLAKEALLLAGHIGKPPSVAVVAHAFASSVGESSLHTGVTQSRTQAASKVSLLTIGAGRLPSEVHMFARGAKVALGKREIVGKPPKLAIDAPSL
jgi:hypothetical protein